MRRITCGRETDHTNWALNARPKAKVNALGPSKQDTHDEPDAEGTAMGGAGLLLLPYPHGLSPNVSCYLLHTLK